MDSVIKLDERFKKNMRGVIEPYTFEVGILKNLPHKWPMGLGKRKGMNAPGYNLRSFLGGAARKTSRKNSTSDMNDVSAAWQKKENYLKKPFKMRRNSDILRFMKTFFNVIKGESQPKRLENALQAIVRNPILRKDYGSNKMRTIMSKGFNRLMIDTGQFFNNIKARVTKRGLNV